MTASGERSAGRARQSDIARIAGVSQSAVSLVLSDKHRERGITDETRLRVLAVAEALDYRPNSVARRLRGMSNRLLGVHSYGDLFPIGVRNYNHAYLVGAHLGAEQAGYDVVLFTSTRAQSRPNPFLNHENRLSVADGTLIIGGIADESHLRSLHQEGYPVVHVGRRTIDGLDVPWVGSDYVQGTADLVHRLVEVGHKHLIYVGTDSDIEWRVDRRQGFTRAVTDLGLDAPVSKPGLEGITMTWLRKIMAAGARTVIAEEHAIALRVVNAATAIGLRLRTDIAVAVLASPSVADLDSWFCGFLGEQREEIGLLAAGLLIELVEGRALESRHKIVPCQPQAFSYGVTPS